MAENLQAFIRANEKPIKKAREEMAELIARVNKEGRTQLATSLQKQLNGLEETVKKRVRSDVAIARPSEKPLLERLAGKWTHPNHPTIFTIQVDGSMQENWKSNGKLHKTPVQLAERPDGTAEGVANGSTYKIRDAGTDAIAMEHWNSAGQRWNVGIVLERIK